MQKADLTLSDTHELSATVLESYPSLANRLAEDTRVVHEPHFEAAM